jgi:predicted PurR-regulated permease PerM
MQGSDIRRPGEVARVALQLLALGALLAAALRIVQPFLLPGVWAAMLAVALWPLLLRSQAWLGGRRAWAVALLSLLLLLILLVPLYLGVRAIVENADRIADLPKSLSTWTIPEPPQWLPTLPFGERLDSRWREIASEPPEARAARLAPYAGDVARWLVGEVGSVGALLLHFLLTVVLSAILFATGERAARGVRRFALRLIGAPGGKAVELAAQAVRAVALGVVLTAVLQSALVGIGFAVVGLPFAALFTTVSFVLSVAQIGPLPLLIGAVVWVYSAHGAAWGTGYLAWALVCGLIDNVVRPVLIKRGADLPLLLIFAGVIGGLLAFGVVGLFVGPVVLAIGYMLLEDWMSEEETAEA